jgi:hypothetical protein
VAVDARILPPSLCARRCNDEFPANRALANRAFRGISSATPPVGPERLALAALGNTHVERDPIQYAFRDGLAGWGGRIRTSAFQNRKRDPL